MSHPTLALEQAGWLIRRDCQFHWTNHDYPNFDAYLETFTAMKRKKAKRERRRVAEAGIVFETRLGPELDEHTLDHVYAFVRDTFLRHGHEPYLTRAFFSEVVRTMGDAFMVKLAVHGGTPVAAAIFFWSQGHLVRALLGLLQRLPQPAFRGLLSPGHRVLHRAGHRPIRARRAGRSQGQSWI